MRSGKVEVTQMVLLILFPALVSLASYSTDISLASFLKILSFFLTPLYRNILQNSVLCTLFIYELCFPCLQMRIKVVQQVLE